MQKYNIFPNSQQFEFLNNVIKGKRIKKVGVTGIEPVTSCL